MDSNLSQDRLVKMLLDGYRNPVFQFIRSRGFSEQDCEDLTQLVFVELTKPSFLKKADREKGRFRTLVLSVTKHVIMDFVKRQKAKKRGGGVPVIHVESIRGEGDDPFEAVDPKSLEDSFNHFWLANLMEKALQKLKATGVQKGKAYAEALTMREFDGMSYAEIAANLNVKESDVKNWIHHAKKHLRVFLEDAIREYSSTREEYEEEIRYFCGKQ